MIQIKRFQNFFNGLLYGFIFMHSERVVGKGGSSSSGIALIVSVITFLQSCRRVGMKKGRFIHAKDIDATPYSDGWRASQSMIQFAVHIAPPTVQLLLGLVFRFGKG